MIDFSTNSTLHHCSEKIRDNRFHVKDVFGATCEICTKSEAHVTINNEYAKEVTFLKIDKCVFGDGERDLKKCDCGIFTNNHAYFVEIKEIQSEKHDARKKKRKEATKQLIQTINSFKLLGLTDLKNTTAVIALIPTFDLNYRKIISAREQGVINEFMSKCG